MSRRSDRVHLFNLVFQIPFTRSREIDPGAMMAKYFEHGTTDTEIDKMFLETSLRGVVSHIHELDAKIQGAAQGWDLTRLAKTDLSILRVAAYEVLYRADVPREVAINEALELAKAYSEEDAPGFVNGVLAKIVKDSDV